MPSVRVLFVGSGDAFGSGGRLQTSILVESDGHRSLLDCGATTLVGLKRAGIDPGSIDEVLVTHLHGDHFGGIPFFVLDGQFSRRARPLVIAGPPGLRRRLTETMEALFPGSATAERKFATEIRELPSEQAMTIGPLAVTPFEVVHASGAPAFALRVETSGRVVAYSGDTEWTESLLRVSAGADLFICEAYFYEKRVPYHLDFTTLMRHRSEIQAKRVVVTHMSGDMLSRLSELSVGGVEAAFDGLSIAIG
jgi:ribonuclease BN (tRNA processing enzyme)